MGKKHREGFTLIELLVLMMVVALAVGFGIPAMGTFMANNRMTGAANDLVSSLHTARAEASTRNHTVTLCASSNWDVERPECDAGGSLLDGWIVFVDSEPPGPDGVVDPAEVVLQAHGPLDDSIRGQDGSGTDSGPPQYVSYRDNGAVEDIQGFPPSVRNIQLCDARGDVSTGQLDANGDDVFEDVAAGRLIQLGHTGRPQLYRMRADVGC